MQVRIKKTLGTTVIALMATTTNCTRPAEDSGSTAKGTTSVSPTPLRGRIGIAKLAVGSSTVPGDQDSAWQYYNYLRPSIFPVGVPFAVRFQLFDKDEKLVVAESGPQKSCPAEIYTIMDTRKSVTDMPLKVCDLKGKAYAAPAKEGKPTAEDVPDAVGENQVVERPLYFYVQGITRDLACGAWSMTIFSGVVTDIQSTPFKTTSGNEAPGLSNVEVQAVEYAGWGNDTAFAVLGSLRTKEKDASGVLYAPPCNGMESRPIQVVAGAPTSPTLPEAAAGKKTEVVGTDESRAPGDGASQSQQNCYDQFSNWICSEPAPDNSSTNTTNTNNNTNTNTNTNDTCYPDETNNYFCPSTTYEEP